MPSPGRSLLRGLIAVRFALTLGALVRAEQGPSSIRGTVRSNGHPVAGATVRVQATAISTLTDATGSFALDPPPSSGAVRLTAWAPGHFIVAADVERGTVPVTIELRELPHGDNAAYSWVSPFSHSSEKACENCHSTGRPDSGLPFDDWMSDAHSRSANGARFLSVYLGTDLSGQHRGAATRFALVPDYGRIALPPDSAAPDYGPGYRLDFPASGGSCGACHAPVAAMKTPFSASLEGLPGDRAGITCDFCHKVAGVKLDPRTGRPWPNTPGVLAFDFLRPAAGTQLFLGPLDDVAPGDDSYLPLYEESRYCAPCHSGQFWGTTIYNSFGEWLDGPYARGESTRTCQECHMPSGGKNLFVPLEKGGRRRDPRTIATHRMRGVDDVAFMESAARLELRAVPGGDRLYVTVDVTNAGAGHHLPTDYPGRNILLLVSATAGDDELPLVEGTRVPLWGGEGRDEDDHAGKPGKGFANALRDRWSRQAPTIAYWRPTETESDNRIPAMQTDSSTYVFARPRSGPVRVVARLLYRRTFRDVARAKLWTDRDLVMQQKEVIAAE